MSGTNPDGSHYEDPGIKWVSYFNGGDALHNFDRSSFGTPQSLGCVELPLAASAEIWPYTPIGTLVTIETLNGKRERRGELAANRRSRRLQLSSDSSL